MYREQIVLPHGHTLDIRFDSERRWMLALKKGRKVIVEYSSEAPYDFKSVEQLRYDFERDAENAQRQGR